MEWGFYVLHLCSFVNKGKWDVPFVIGSSLSGIALTSS